MKYINNNVNLEQYNLLIKKIFDNNVIYDNENFLRLIEKFYKGVDIFRKTNYSRNLSEGKIIWRHESTILFQYNEDFKNNPIILFVPSLINKSYILDLFEGKSLVRFLAQHDINVFLIDWGNPTENEINYNLNNYVIDKINLCIDLLSNKYQRPIILAGYCIGGMLSVAATILKSDLVERLVLIATPWDFKDMMSSYHLGLESLNYIINNLSLTDTVSAYNLYNFFCNINLQKIFNKFSKFAELESDSDEFKTFIFVENWLNDGIDITTGVAKQLLVNFLKNNESNNNQWIIESYQIIPENIKAPTFIANPINDNIVPSDSMKPLIKHIKNKNVISSNAGHIGMIIGRKAKNDLWIPLLNWIK